MPFAGHGCFLGGGGGEMNGLLIKLVSRKEVSRGWLLNADVWRLKVMGDWSV